MKQTYRLLCLALALLFALSALALGEDEAPAAADDPVLFTFDGKACTASEFKPYIDELIASGALESAADYDTAIEYYIQEQVILAKISELGLDQFTDDEKAALQAEAQKQWDELLDSYVSYYLTEDSEEARAQLRLDAAKYMEEAMGVNLEIITQYTMSNDSYERLIEGLFAQQGIAVTDQDIAALFNETVAQHKEMYEDQIAMYELFKAYGQDIWYQPSGYRGVLHILLPVDEALLDAYQNAQNTYEESMSDSADASGDSAALLQAAQAARQAVLDSQKTTLDDIYARLAKGESFESLIERYGQDDGMKEEAALKNGYEVHTESAAMGWDPAFIAGAFSEKMQKPGDVSDPVVSSFGIHVIYYLRDVPSGAVEMTEGIKEEIKEYLESNQKNQLIDQAIQTWKTEHAIVLNTDAIEAAKSAAAAAAETAASENETPADSDDLSSLSEEELNALFAQMNADDPNDVPEGEAAPAD